MKRNLITRIAVTAVATGAISFATPLFAQEGATTGEGSKGASAGMSPSSSGSAKSMSKSESSKSMSKGNGAALSSADKEFIMEAGKGGMMEVEMGKMAEQKGQSAEVKKIGKMMVTDHSKANTELMGLAQKKGVTLDKKAKMDKMNMGSDFDSDYLSTMVKDHQKDIAAFENEAKNGSDADVKSWASKTLPTLKKHMKMVQAAQGKMGSKKS